MVDGELRDEQKEYIVKDLFDTMKRYGEYNNFDYSDIDFEKFKKVYGFFIDNFLELESLFADYYKDDREFKVAGLEPYEIDDN